MKRFPYHVILFALFPLLSLYDHNKDALELSFALRSATIIFLGAITLCAASYVFLHNITKSGIFASTFIILFFSFGHILKKAYAPVMVYPEHFGLVEKLCYIFVLIAIIIAAATFRALLRAKNNLFSLNKLLNIVSLFLTGYLLISISTYALNTAKNENEKYLTKKEISEKPDIYYIILDGYGRNDILKDLYAFDNTNFIERLERKHFYVAKKSTSNYHQTYLSLSSSLNMSYLDQDKLLGANTKTVSPKEMIKNNQLISFFESQGYTIIATPTTWTGIQGNIQSDITFNGMIFNDFERMFITLTPLQLYIDDKFLTKEHRQTILSGFKALAAIPRINKPTLTIAHIYSPHPPFVFDENGIAKDTHYGFSKLDGNTLFEDHRAALTIDSYREDYISQLIFANKKIIQSIDQILDNSTSPPIIILQSDHGPGSQLFFGDPDKTNLHERMSILNAYYLPDKGKEMLYDSITPVNSFRVVINSLFDANLELLQDRNYFTGKSNMYDFIDVTNRLEKK